MTDTTSNASAPGEGQILRTTIDRRWWLKIGIFALVCIGLGVWGYVDATMVYPSRGKRASEWLEKIYLEAYRDANGNMLDNNAGVKDPSAELARLEKLKADGALGRPRDLALHDWLNSLSRISWMMPEHTTYPRPNQFAAPKGSTAGDQIKDAASRLADLQKIKAPDKPLERYDLPFQWAICVLGFGFGAYLIFLILRVFSTSFRFEPATQRLHLPGGHEIGPGDLAEPLDRRKWDKFMVTLNIKPDHKTLPGKAVELDLLRYKGLEDWVVAMEKTAFPDAGDSGDSGEPVQKAESTTSA